MSDIYEKNRCLYRDDGTFWLDDWEFNRPTFFTGYVNEYFSRKVDKVKENNSEFLELLHKKVFRKNKKEITRLCVVEKGKKNKKIHTHLIIETPIHLSKKDFERFVLKSWLETKGGIKSYDFTPVYYLPDLKEYLGKDQSIKTELGVDEINSYTNKSVSINS